MKKREPIIEQASIAIMRAIANNGGRAPEYFGIPVSQWHEFDAAYVRQFGERLALPYERMNLVLRSIPVCPVEEA